MKMKIITNFKQVLKIIIFTLTLCFVLAAILNSEKLARVSQCLLNEILDSKGFPTGI